MSRLLAAQRALTVPGWVKDELWRRARATPSLDLRFADSKSLVDATTGANLVDFTRASSGTYVDSEGVIRQATTNLVTWSEEFDNAAWSPTNSTITPNVESAPNGTLTADKQTHTGNGPRISRFSVATVAALTDFTFSFYAKAGTSSYAACSIYDGTTTGKRFWFNLTTGLPGSITNIGTGYSFATSNMQDIGNGWYRCIATIANGSNTTVSIDGISVCLNQDGVLTPSVSGLYGYIWGAQLEQSTTVGEYIPTTSTINSAPRFDHDPTTGESLGLLVEEQRTNLLLRSEEFDDASWSSFGLLAFGSGSIINATSAPDGTTAADLITESTATATRREIFQSGFTSTSPGVLSCFVKAAGRDFAGLRFYAASSNWVRCSFDLISGTAGSIAAGTGSTFTSASAAITPFPNGWYRISLTATRSPGVSFAIIDINTSLAPTVTAAGGAEEYNGNGTSGLYLWGAQLEAGSFPTSYIPTTDAAATRSADVASITDGPSGSNFSSWYRQDEGTVFAEFRDSPGTGPEAVFSISNETYQNRFSMFTNSLTDANARVVSASVSANPGKLALSSVSANKYVLAAKAQTDGAIAAGNGTFSSPATPGAMPTVDRLYLGLGDNGSMDYLNGHIRRLTYWPQRLSNATLQTITQ